MKKNHKNLFLLLLGLFAIVSLDSCCCCWEPPPIPKVTPQKDIQKTEIIKQDIVVAEPEESKQEPITFYKQGDIYMMNDINDKPIKLTKGEHPSFNPQTTKIAYQNDGIYIFDLDTHKSTLLDKTKGIAFSPKWSPNGEWIAYIDRNNKYKLTLIKPDNSEKRVILDQSKIASEMFFKPVWAKDSKSMYVHDMDTLYQISTDGNILSKTPVPQITGSKSATSSEDVFAPSPIDSNIFLFTRYVYDNKKFEDFYGEPSTSIFLFDKKDDSISRITPIEYFSINPVWSKDGEKIYFGGYKGVSNEMYPFRLYQINLNNGNIIEITKGENISI